MQTLIKLLEFLHPYGSHSYFIMLGILICCGFGLPMPEDIVLITGGILAARDVTHFGGVVAVCMLGVLLGDGMIFTLGWHFGASVKKMRLFRTLLNDKRDQQVQGIIHKFGDKVVFMARFMPGLRTPIFLTCGTYKLKPWKFLMLDGLAALISVPLWIYVGYIFGENLEELEQKIRQFEFGIYAVLAFIIVLFVTGATIKKRALKNIATE